MNIAKQKVIIFKVMRYLFRSAWIGKISLRSAYLGEYVVFNYGQTIM